MGKPEIFKTELLKMSLSNIGKIPFRVAIFLFSFTNLTSCKFIRTVRAINATQKTDVLTFVREDTINFRYSNQGWIVLPVKITTAKKSITEDFFYDSGAITMIANDSLYDELGAKYVRGVLPIPTNTVFGTKYDTLSEVKYAELQIGKSSYKMSSLKADRKNYFAEDRLAGVIGPTFFASQKILIDFEKQQLIINPNTVLDKNWKKLEMSSIAVGKNPVIKAIKVGNLPVLDWYMDTGNPFDLVLQTKDMELIKNYINPFRPYQLSQKERPIDAAGHLGDSIQYRSQESSLNGDPSNQFMAFATLVKENKRSRSNNMGIGFMKKTFRQVVFDNPSKTFYYCLASIDSSKNGSPISDVALAGTASNDVFVSAISTNSTWFKQGLRADHYITAVNGKPVAYWLEHKEEFRKAEYQSIEFLDNGVRKTVYK